MKGHCHAQSLLQLLCDDLTGDADRNVIHGGPNGDVLYGLDGNDRLFGDAGIDTIRGGAGRDVMTGGADNDIFAFDSIADAGIGNASRDIVTDFGVNADRINLAIIVLESITASLIRSAFTP